MKQDIEQVDFQSIEGIRRYQERRLGQALSYLQRHSPFYQQMFKQQGIDVNSIRTLEDLSKLPFTEKSDLQLYNESFLCVPREKIVDYITTSGTIGDPVMFAMTDADLDRLAYNEQRSFQCTGADAGSLFQLMTTIDKRFMAGLAYFLGARKLGAGIVRVGNGLPELQWDTIRRISPDTIIVVPSFILKILDYAEEHGIDYRRSSVRRAICIGENVRQQDFSLNLLGRKIKERWDIQLFSTYASTEMSTSFTECEHGCGGHHQPELIICELIGEDGMPVKEGEVGELTVTTLGVEGMPLLRFKTDDLACFHTAPCRCGRFTMRISPIVGRLNHMVKYKGTTLYPPAIFDVLDHTPYVEVYVMIVEDNACGNDRILLKVGLKESPSFDVVKELKDRFRTRIRVAPEIEICSVAEIMRMSFPTSSRKPIKFIDQRKKTRN